MLGSGNIMVRIKGPGLAPVLTELVWFGRQILIL